MFVQLAGQLIKEGKKDKAKKALDYSLEVIPSTTVPHQYIETASKEMADQYISLGDTVTAQSILIELANNSVEYLTWYLSLNDTQLMNAYEETVRHFLMLEEIDKSLAKLSSYEGDKEKEERSSDIALHYAQKFDELYRMFNERIGKK